MAGQRLETHFTKPPKRKFTPDVRRSLAQLLRQNPRKSARWLTEKLNERMEAKVSLSGVQKELKSMGYARKARKHPNLTSANKRERLNFANAQSNTDWRRVWAYDESYFNLQPSSKAYWTKPSVSHRVAPRKLTNAQDSVSLCIAVAISYNRKSDLCFLPKGWAPENLINVFRVELLPSIGWDPQLRRCRTFLMDNDGRHHNRQFKAFLGEHGLMKPRGNGFLPANSPDLNPVENVFGLMKNFVYDLNPGTLEELKQAVIDAWKSIPNQTLKNLFASMPGRMQAVIDKNGDRIEY